MNDEQVFRMLVETNPVPDVDDVALPEALREIDEGSPTMTTDIKTPRRQATDRRAPVQRRGPLLGAAAALVALIAGATMWAITGGGDDVADHPGISSVNTAYEAMNNGDMESFYAQLTDRAAETDDREYRSLLVEMNEQIELQEPCRLLEPSPTSGRDRIQCDVVFTNDFFRPAGIVLQVTDTFVIADDGSIDLALYQFDDGAAADDYARAFWRWLADTHPTVFATMSSVSPAVIATLSYPDNMLTALEYVDEFIAQSPDYPVTE